MTALEGKLQVTPGVKVSGEYATNPEVSDTDDELHEGRRADEGGGRRSRR